MATAASMIMIMLMHNEEIFTILPLAMAVYSLLIDFA